MLLRILATLTIVAHLTTAIHLDCTYIMLSFNNILHFSCDGDLQVLGPNVTITSVTPPKDGKTFADVHGLDIENKEVHFLPMGLEKFFTNLQSLRVKKSNLREIHKNSFAPFPNLRYVNLEHNALSIIEGDLFAKNTHLETIWLSHNKIEEIEVNAFDGLKELKDLDLRGVACIGRSPNRHDVKAVIEAVKKSCRNCPKGLAELTDEFKKVLAENQKMKSMAGVVEKLEDKNEHLRADKVKMKEEIEMKSAELKKTGTELLKLHTELTKSSAVLKKANAELKRAGAELTQVKADVLILRAELKQSKLEHKSEIGKLQAELKKLKTEHGISQTELHKVRTKHNKSQAELQKSRAEYHQTRTELEKSRAEHTKIHAEIQKSHAELQATHKNLKTELQNSKAEHIKSTVKLQKYLDECQEMKRQKDKRNTINDETLAELRETKLNAEKQLQNTTLTLQKEIEILKIKNLILVDQKLKYENEQKILTDEIQILRENNENQKNFTLCEKHRDEFESVTEPLNLTQSDAESLTDVKTVFKNAEIQKNDEILEKLQNVVEDDISCFKNEKFAILLVSVIVLVLFNTITLICCCLRTKKYTKSMRISSISEYSEEYKVPLRNDEKKNFV